MCERCVDRVIALYYPPSIRASVQKREDRSSGYALSVIVVLNSDEEGGGGEMTVVVVEGAQMKQRQRRGRQTKV